MDLSNLGDLAKQMQDAYSDGLGAMNKAGETVAEDMKPDHEIEVNIKLNADIEGRKYLVESNLLFEIELNPFLGEGSDRSEELSTLLDGIGVDLGDDKAAVMEQLGNPRVVGVIKKIETKDLEVSNEKGKVDASLNDKGTILLTIKDKDILVNFESVLSFPNHTDLYVAIPSMEEMQKHIVLDMQGLDKKVEFKWQEKDKDGLSVEGDIQIKEI
jgi:hypothetical protein